MVCGTFDALMVVFLTFFSAPQPRHRMGVGSPNQSKKAVQNSVILAHIERLSLNLPV
jgi:hypothetical protein